MGCLENFNVFTFFRITILGDDGATINSISETSLNRTRHLRTRFPSPQNEDSFYLIERNFLFTANEKLLALFFFDFHIAINSFTGMNGL